MRPINEVCREEEWPTGRKKGKKISRALIWSWVHQGFLKVYRDANDGRNTALVDVEEVRRLMLTRPAERGRRLRP